MRSYRVALSIREYITMKYSFYPAPTLDPAHVLTQLATHAPPQSLCDGACDPALSSMPINSDPQNSHAFVFNGAPQFGHFFSVIEFTLCLMAATSIVGFGSDDPQCWQTASKLLLRL